MTEIIPSVDCYQEDHNFLTGALFAKIVEFEDKRLNLINLSNIHDFFSYFIKEEKALKQFVRDFLKRNTAQNHLISVFFEDKKGWHKTHYNETTGKFNGTNSDYFQVYFDRENFLGCIHFPEILEPLFGNIIENDDTASKKASEIRRHSIHCVEDVLDLKYYLETGINLREKANIKILNDSTKNNQPRPEDIKYAGLREAKAKIQQFVLDEIDKEFQLMNHIEIAHKIEHDTTRQLNAYKTTADKEKYIEGDVLKNVIKDALKKADRTDKIFNYNSSKSK